MDDLEPYHWQLIEQRWLDPLVREEWGGSFDLHAKDMSIRFLQIRAGLQAREVCKTLPTSSDLHTLSDIRGQHALVLHRMLKRSPFDQLKKLPFGTVLSRWHRRIDDDQGALLWPTMVGFWRVNSEPWGVPVQDEDLVQKLLVLRYRDPERLKAPGFADALGKARNLVVSQSRRPARKSSTRRLASACAEIFPDTRWSQLRKLLADEQNVHAVNTVAESLGTKLLRLSSARVYFDGVDRETGEWKSGCSNSIDALRKAFNRERETGQ
ncbi:MAG: hypothetical protein AAAFM81_11060 [Pseudomonadota bacterium]